MSTAYAAVPGARVACWLYPYKDDYRTAGHASG